LADFLLYFEKHMIHSLRLQNGSSVLNKTTQKLSAKVSMRGPETTGFFAFLYIHPCSQLHTKERIGFIL